MCIRDSSQRDLAQRMEMLQFKAEEIRALAPQPDEEEALRVERVRLANAEQLGRHAAEALSLIHILAQGLVTVRPLAGGEQTRFPLADLIPWLQEQTADGRPPTAA